MSSLVGFQLVRCLGTGKDKAMKDKSPYLELASFSLSSSTKHQRDSLLLMLLGITVYGKKESGKILKEVTQVRKMHTKTY